MAGFLERSPRGCRHHSWADCIGAVARLARSLLLKPFSACGSPGRASARALAARGTRRACAAPATAARARRRRHAAAGGRLWLASLALRGGARLDGHCLLGRALPEAFAPPPRCVRRAATAQGRQPPHEEHEEPAERPLRDDAREQPVGRVALAQAVRRRDDDVRREPTELEEAYDEVLHVELVPPDPGARRVRRGLLRHGPSQRP